MTSSVDDGHFSQEAYEEQRSEEKLHLRGMITLRVLKEQYPLNLQEVCRDSKDGEAEQGVYGVRS